MLALTRNLFNDLESFHRELDNLFERSWGPSARVVTTGNAQTGFLSEFESYMRDGNLVYRFAIPGVDPKDVDISVQGNQINVKGERKGPAGVTDENWYVRGFRYGQFERTFTLPDGLEADQLAASFHNGVLELSAPVAKAHLPRKVEIKQIGSSGGKHELKASA